MKLSLQSAHAGTLHPSPKVPQAEASSGLRFRVWGLGLRILSLELGFRVHSAPARLLRASQPNACLQLGQYRGLNNG